MGRQGRTRRAAAPRTPRGPSRDRRSGSQIDHLNIAVPDLEAATAFYEPVLATLGIVRILTIPAAPAAGATEELLPTVHPEYHDDHYGGFVTDPLGISLEAACHAPVPA